MGLKLLSPLDSTLLTFYPVTSEGVWRNLILFVPFFDIS